MPVPKWRGIMTIQPYPTASGVRDLTFQLFVAANFVMRQRSRFLMSVLTLPRDFVAASTRFQPQLSRVLCNGSQVRGIADIPSCSFALDVSKRVG